MNHDEDYPAEYLAKILKEVKTIAMVGASSDPTKFSYGVLRVLRETGYNMIPVNPMEAGIEIRGLKCHESLSSIESPVDMVQIFRNSKAAYAVTEEAIKIGAKVVWMQIGVHNDAAAEIAEAAGLKVVMNRCPKIELFRPFWKPRLNQRFNIRRPKDLRVAETVAFAYRDHDPCNPEKRFKKSSEGHGLFAGYSF